MTDHTLHLTDELLQRALTELAEGTDGTVLLNDVLRSVDSTAQVRRRPWDVPGWRGAGLPPAATLLVTAAIGSALVLANRQPEPQPSPSVPALLPRVISASDFVAPFTYSLPSGQRVSLAPMGVTSCPSLWPAWRELVLGRSKSSLLPDPCMHARISRLSRPRSAASGSAGSHRPSCKSFGIPSAWASDRSSQRHSETFRVCCGNRSHAQCVLADPAPRERFGHWGDRS